MGKDTNKICKLEAVGLLRPLAMRYHRLPSKQRDYTDARAEMLSAYRSRMDLSSFLDAPGDYARFRG